MRGLPPSADEVLLDFPNWTVGQILVELGDNSIFHVGVKGMPQLRNRARRSDNHDLFHLFCADEALQRGGDMRDEALLLQLMPIGSVHAAAQICAGPLEGPSG